jgi:hypothetical protein
VLHDLKPISHSFIYLLLFSHDTHLIPTSIRWKKNHGCLKIECLPLQAFYYFQDEIFMLCKDICEYPLSECWGFKLKKQPWFGLRVLPWIFFDNKKKVQRIEM